MKNLHKKIKEISGRIKDLQKSEDYNYILVTEEVFEKYKADIESLGIQGTDIKIFRIPNNVNMTELVEETRKKIK